MRKLLLVAALAIGLAVLAASASGDPGKGPKAGGHAFQHVFVIMLENHSKSSVIDDPNAPYITSLAHKYATAANYYGVTHPSEPNYIASISGSNWGVNDDQASNRFDHLNIVDLLEANHLSWAAYMESMPSAGFTGDQYPANAALYVSKHNPFVLFDDIRSDSGRLQHIKPYSEFANDMKSNQLPNYVWISPNQCHDMHGGVYVQIAPDGSDGTPCPYGSTKDDANDASLKKKADDFVKGAVDTIMSTTDWKNGHTAIFIVTDENDFVAANTATDEWESAEGCCDSPYLPPFYRFLGSNGLPDGNVWAGGVYGGGKIPAIVLTAKGKSGFVSETPHNHYSMLSTILWNWGLPPLANTADTLNVKPMTEFFTKGAANGTSKGKANGHAGGKHEGKGKHH
ncbi:MAG TPA: alkaline phosphatase family protein [Gaiellaceae bacterium]|nr:alkaline phosphatase family protein [Gaiellaceae bacterium]